MSGIFDVGTMVTLGENAVGVRSVNLREGAGNLVGKRQQVQGAVP